MAKDTHLIQTGEEVQAAINKIIALSVATATTPGIMTAEDKRKLDSIGIHFNSTEYWDNDVDYIPGAGEIVIYSDYKTIEKNGVSINVPGIKVGSGNGYVQDLAFVGEADAESLLAHISDTAAHTTAAEKLFWSRKLNVEDSHEVSGETLIFNRN